MTAPWTAVFSCRFQKQFARHGNKSLIYVNDRLRFSRCAGCSKTVALCKLVACCVTVAVPNAFID
ncbi:hypothetical protein REMIM1_PE00356 (plasmid) [Rhizobium etli bv. mimosae str. Mim1]|nr:hypothetical protein REMIM1_PE00356 [Rhizobium etli bv. mimosae str. Mim1]